MTINFGKRDPGGLTAANPGDTLYIPFASHNDSGDSEAPVGLAVADIEIFKNGGVTPRATDSGYSLISDTGQYGDRIGLNRFSIQLFNTSDDTGFFDAGSQYHVAVDSVNIDGKVVRFFAAIFEIGTPRANVVEVDGDTGAAAHLAQMVDEHDTGRLAADMQEIDGDTGAADQLGKAFATTPSYFQQVDVQQLDGDTGFADRLGKFTSLLTGAGQIDTGTGLHDTGDVAAAVWAKDARLLTGFAFDTGIQQALARVDTGLSETIDRTLAKVDTGVVHDVWGASTRTLTAFAFDTGVQQRLDRLDTGMSETVDRVLADTDTGLKTGLSVTATAVSDTGLNERLTAIQNKTDDLTFSVANVVDANIQYVNDTQVAGTGANGDEWGPA